MIVVWHGVTAWRFENPVDMQGPVDKNIGVTVTGSIDISMATASSPYGCCSRKSSRDGDAAGVAGCRGRWKAVTAAAGRRRDGCPQERQIPCRSAVGAGNIASRHGGAVTVNVAALSGGHIVCWHQCTVMGSQCTPDKIGGAVHVRCRRNGSRHGVTVVAVNGSGQFDCAGCQVQEVGADLGVSVRRYLWNCR